MAVGWRLWSGLAVLASMTLASRESLAVGGGASDDADAYPYVGLVVLPGRTCSGILITPTWVLTANHCVTGSTEWSDCQFWSSGDSSAASEADGTASVYFGGAPDTAAPADFAHTRARSGSLVVREDRPIDYCSPDDASLDIALVKLDTRVPLSSKKPLHPGLSGETPCLAAVDDPNDFTGVLVGYGGTDLAGPSPASATRRFRGSGGWDLEAKTHGWVYSNGWDYPLTPPGFGPLFSSSEDWYHGAVSRDSGGALIGLTAGSSTPVLCGVIGRTVAEMPTVVFGVPVTSLRVITETAGVDSLSSLTFLAAHVLDAKGRWMGECDGEPPELRDVDSDHDLIPDACDVCPLVPARDEGGRNTYDLDGGGPDADGDGVPDVCDDCPDDPNPYDAWSHAQRDADGDGVGDACDTCPFSGWNERGDVVCCASDADCGPSGRCVAVPPGQGYRGCGAGRCSRPVDRDADGVGDACDNCPSSRDGRTAGAPNPGQEDADADGVGDACDDCPGFARGAMPEDTNMACARDSDCRRVNEESVCVSGHYMAAGRQSTARCTKGADPDGDGVGEACDDCPHVNNPEASRGLQPNCNVDAEIALGDLYPYTGDACDPAPCTDLRVVSAPPPVGTACPAPPDDTAGPWVRLALTPYLLPASPPAVLPRPGGGAARATVVLRRCPCEALLPWPTAFSVESCSRVCPLALDEGSAGAPWQTMAVREVERPRMPVPATPAGFADGAALDLEVVNPRLEPGKAVFADWYLGETAFATRSVLWTHTVVHGAPAPRSFARSSHYMVERFGRRVQPPEVGPFLPPWSPFRPGDPVSAGVLPRVCP